MEVVYSLLGSCLLGLASYLIGNLILIQTLPAIVRRLRGATASPEADE